MLADLHMHSTVSDGWRDPDEVANLAADHGVRVMALTDHDTFLGVNRARAVAHRRGLGYVPALEVTTYPPNQLRHILGHGVDMNHPRLLAMLQRTQSVFRKQTEAWIRVLQELGIGGDLGLDAYAYKPTVMPGAVLKVILQHGVMAERDAWDSVRKAVDFMPADFYAPIPSPKEAVDAIHEVGFVATHDGLARLRRRMVERVLTSCQEDTAASEALLTMLRRYATESAREEARLYCDELVADEFITVDYRSIAA